MKRTIKLTESKLRSMIQEAVNGALREDNDFSKRYDDAMVNARRRRKFGGMELKNPEGEWEYDDIKFNPQTMQMSCMGATIDVDSDWSIDSALEALLEELYNQGYGGE